MIARLTASAGRFSPRGPLGIEQLPSLFEVAKLTVVTLNNCGNVLAKLSAGLGLFLRSPELQSPFRFVDLFFDHMEQFVPGPHRGLHALR
jgi:hypothetical protein